ncbi:hypothetical protein ALC57_16268, partial [Trachymyrmex cornetzi]
TYTGGRGESVIDYVLVDEEAREQIEFMEVGDTIESDHHPLIVAWRGGKEKGENKGKEGRGVNRGVWEGRVVFRERLGEWREGRGEENKKETEERIREVLGSIEKERDKERKGRQWDKEWKRRFGKDWKRRVWLFDKLIWAMVSYGVEIWGWKEREKQWRVYRKGVERRTLGYLVREELQREKLRAKAGKRAWAFEERLRRGVGSRLARLCWEEAMGNLRKREKLEGWKRERAILCGKRGGEVNFEEIQERDREMQRVERWEKIRDSRYNRWYRWVKGERLPKYLSKGWGEGRWRRVARFRLGNEVKEGKYWEEEEERKCRLCGSGRETWEHIWEGCRAWKMGEGGSWQEVMGTILGEEGEGEGWMREVEEERKRMREEGDVGEGKND